MQNNLFFLSGPHGSGKTTLGDEIAKEDPRVIIPELKTRTCKFDISPQERLVLKICQRSLENYEALCLARQNPDGLILANRCIYDQQVYDSVYAQRGWMPHEEQRHIDLLAESFYINGLRRPQAIVLNPGFEVVSQHLKRRWQESGKKWREDDDKYTLLACQGFERFRDNPEVFYIDHEVDLNSRAEIRGALEWMLSQVSLKEPIAQ